METDIKALDSKIKTIKNAAEELQTMAENFPAVRRNLVRLLASTKMLELEVSDLADLEDR